MTRKFVGIDLHMSTMSTMAVRLENGEMFIEPMPVKTEPKPLITAIKAIDGEVEVLLEASTGARWVSNLLAPHVEKVAICHPADIKRNRGNKTDKADARELSKRLWLNDYTEVYHSEEMSMPLNELVRRHLRTVNKVVRTKNQIKALYRQNGLVSAGTQMYDEEGREHWLQKLDCVQTEISIRQLLDQLDLLEKQRNTNEKQLVKQAKSRDGYSSVVSLPGFGAIRTAKAMGIIGTPFRFPTKRQLWRYSCLAVVVHDSRQWTSNGPQGVTRHHEQITRGLNNDGAPQLKKIFRSAADTAVSNYEEVREDYEVRCTQKSPKKAKLDIARKLASQLLTVWKREEEYDPDKARWKEFPSDD